MKTPFLSCFLCLSFVFPRRFRCGNGGQTPHSGLSRLASERCCCWVITVLLSCRSGVRAGCSRSWFGRIPTVIRPAHDRYPVGPRSWFAPQTLAPECKVVVAASPLRLLRKWDCRKSVDARTHRILCKRKKYVQVVSFQRNVKLRLRKQEMTKNKGEPFLFM